MLLFCFIYQLCTFFLRNSFSLRHQIVCQETQDVDRGCASSLKTLMVGLKESIADGTIKV